MIKGYLNSIDLKDEFYLYEDLCREVYGGKRERGFCLLIHKPCKKNFNHKRPIVLLWLKKKSNCEDIFIYFSTLSAFFKLLIMPICSLSWNEV